MKLCCNVKVEILADYVMREPKTLENALKDYTACSVYGKKNYSISEDNRILKLKWVGYLVFDSYANFVANLEEEIKTKLHYDLLVRDMDKWNIQYTILNVGGYDE